MMRDWDNSEDFRDMKGVICREIRRREIYMKDRGDLILENSSYYVRSQNSSFRLEEEFSDRILKEEVIGHVEAMKGLSFEFPHSFEDLYGELMDYLEKGLIRRVIIMDDRLRESEEEVIDD